MPLPPMPEHHHRGDASAGGQTLDRACMSDGGGARSARAAPRAAPNMPRVSITSWHPVSRPRRSARCPSASALAISRSCSASSTVVGLVDQHHGDAVARSRSGAAVAGCRGTSRRRSRAAGPCPRGRPGSRAVVDRCGHVLHGRSSRMSVDRSCRRVALAVLVGPKRAPDLGDLRARPRPASSAASRLRRSSGSVFDGRRLNHQSPTSTVSPSRRSWSSVGEVLRRPAR